MKAKHPTPELYLAFPKAAAALRDRINATASELACWIFFDQIKAYTHVSDFIDPPEISLTLIALTNWTTAAKDSPPHLNALQGAYFLKSDIENFDPQSRYISFGDLIQRWSAQCQTEDSAAALISSKIGEDRLHDFAPGLGPTILSQTHFTTSIPHPPAEWAMFDCAEVEAVEASDFPEDSPSSHSQQKTSPNSHLQASEQSQAIIERKNNVMVSELCDIWPNIRNDLNNAHRNGLIQAKLPEHGIWDMNLAIAWAIKKRGITKDKATQLVATDPTSELSILLSALIK